MTGLVHTTGGYALYAMHTTATSFGLTQQTGPSNSNASNKDVYACVADAGWITGHTYIVSNPTSVLQYRRRIADSIRIVLLIKQTVPLVITLGLWSTPQWYFNLHVRVDTHVSRLWSILGYGPTS